MTKRRLLFAITAMLLLALGLSRFTTLPLSAAISHNRLATNRLATNRLATNRLATNRLATNALSSTRLEAAEAANELLSTVEGRDLFSYLIGCALAPGTTIEATIPGAADTAPPDSNYTCSSGRCSFDGSLGLAPDWIEHKLSSKDERWVSACILTRVNNFDTTEAISLRGTHPGLAVGEGEVVLFGADEGAFYGNIFTHEDDPIEAYACQGRGPVPSSEHRRSCPASLRKGRSRQPRIHVLRLHVCRQLRQLRRTNSRNHTRARISTAPRERSPSATRSHAMGAGRACARTVRSSPFTFRVRSRRP